MLVDRDRARTRVVGGDELDEERAGPELALSSWRPWRLTSFACARRSRAAAGHSAQGEPARTGARKRRARRERPESCSSWRSSRTSRPSRPWSLDGSYSPRLKNGLVHRMVCIQFICYMARMHAVHWYPPLEPAVATRCFVAVSPRERAGKIQIDARRGRAYVLPDRAAPGQRKMRWRCRDGAPPATRPGARILTWLSRRRHEAGAVLMITSVLACSSPPSPATP